MRVPALFGMALLAVVLVSCGGADSGNEAPFEVEGPPRAVETDGDEATQAASGGGEASKVIYRGARANPPLPKPDVVLTDTNGDPFDFLAETEGYLTLLYLGYTHCPDICPTHLLELSKVLEAMDPELVERIRVVFITTDPERDDADRHPPLARPLRRELHRSHHRTRHALLAADLPRHAPDHEA